MSDPISRSNAIALLTHAPSDLTVLYNAETQLPDGFSSIVGINLQNLDVKTKKNTDLAKQLANTSIIILRVLGRLASIPGLTELVKQAQAQQQHLIVISGVGELDAELAATSTVSSEILHQVETYFQAGGSSNLAQLLRFLSDHFLLTAFGYEPVKSMPEHGIYHPDLSETACIADWLSIKARDKPSVGIVFYRAHWLSGNTRFIDALIDELEKLGMNVLPIFTSSLRSGRENNKLPSALSYFLSSQCSRIDILVNTTSFAMGEITAGQTTPAGWSVNVLEQLNVPVLQAITSGMTKPQWEISSRGLNPLDAAMNVMLPEFDGRIITVPISFKAKSRGLPNEEIEYDPAVDRVKLIAKIAKRFAELRKKRKEDKRIAFVFTNSNSKASQIGNAVGLDAPASLMKILEALKGQGYCVNNLPENGTALIHELIDRCAYDKTYLSSQQWSQAVGQVDTEQYATWFAELPSDMQGKMIAQWGKPPGDAYVQDGKLALAGIELGNAIVVLQPPRGYGMDPDAIYHQPDLPPTHHYYALYRWLRDEWQADALVHVGKHGTLEWLPGKGIGLSSQCFPDALLVDLPLFYPFIINDPGEGAQAKRRSHAVVVDHLTPPMTTADTYGALAQLTQLVDEYYQVEVLDPAKLPLLQQQIWDLVKETNLDTDLHARLFHDHHDHHHNHDHTSLPLHSSDPAKQCDHSHEDHQQHELPSALSTMGGADVAHLIEDLDGYLCELGAAQIRDGLHVLGQALNNDQLIDMLIALTRLNNQHIPGLPSVLAKLFSLNMDELLRHSGRRLKNVDPDLEQLLGVSIITGSDAIAAIEALSRQLFVALAQEQFTETSIDKVLTNLLGKNGADLSAIHSILVFVCNELIPKLTGVADEVDNLLKGLAGAYVPAGPSGSPTRGMAHILPTGRNFYSVDPRSLPSQSAWRVGQQLAHEVVTRYQRETGQYPESVAISIWGTSAMRTHGDDVAQILALLGTRPVWQNENRQIMGIEVIPPDELNRPRIDVTTRISGFFRDAFPQLIDLIDDAVNAVIQMDEPLSQNYVRKHYLAELAVGIGSGLAEKQASQRAALRIFGSKPGSYGAGILPLIQEQNWQNDSDFAESYVNWGGYAYSREHQGKDERDAFRTRLSRTQVALHNQDNREHDIFDSDDYLQFHGGMIATIRSLTGKQPRHYFGDSHDPASVQVKDLKEETLRVFRSRVINPKWLNSIQKHGYKGGLELTATVDYLFGYDATSHVMDDWMYEDIANTYALDVGMQRFLEEANPWAQNAITERLLEAAKRGMWSDPEQQTLDDLQALFLHSETLLESRGEKPRSS